MMTLSPLNTSAQSAVISSKPPYAIPSMADVRALPWNGFRVASLFSGCGGSCLGFRMAGFRIVYANEFVPAARDTYRANHPSTPLDPNDVRAVTATTLIASAQTALESFAGHEIDVLEGSPPCASFSTAGSGSKGWSHTRSYSDRPQRVDDLFFEYARIVRELQPRVFVAENVAGLVRGDAKGYFLEILEALKNAGYRVRCEKLDAQWLGVPQHRERVIFIGVREDLKRAPAFPKPCAHRYTVADVLPHLKRIKLGGCADNWQSPHRPFPTLTTRSVATNINAYFSAAFVETHEGVTRRLTIDEVRLLSSFPLDFVLTGTHAQQWERLARAVPPLMMRSIAQTVREQILEMA